MAILGFQLVSTLVGASLLSKIITYLSLGRYILCSNLYRFVHPSTEELLKASNKNVNIVGKKNRKNNFTVVENQAANISKTVEVELQKTNIRPQDILQLHYFTDYQWLLDFSLCCLLVYFANEIVYGYFIEPNDRINLSVIWIILGLCFSIRAMYTTNLLYFSMKDTSDAMIIVLSTFSFLVLALIVLIIPERHLSFGFSESYKNLTDNLALNFPNSSLKINLMSIKGVLVVLSALIGGFMTHSGLRFGKMYMDSLLSASNFMKLLLHISFISPLIILCFWLTEVKTKMLKLRMGVYQMTSHDYKALKLFLLFGFFSLRMYLARIHLQSYLNLAQSKIQNLRKEAGKISVIDYQKMVARIFYCLCLVAIQYFGPVLLCMYLTILFKSLANISWLGSHYFDLKADINSTRRTVNGTDPEIVLPPVVMSLFGDLNDSIKNWSISIVHLRALFSPLFYESIMGYLVWFSLVSLQLNSFLGLIYHRQLGN